LVKQPDGPKTKRPKRQARRYTDAEIAAAKAAYESAGPREASRSTGIPLKTITNWARRHGWSFETTGATAAAVDAVKARVAAKRVQLLEEFVDAAREAVRLSTAPHVELKVVSDGEVMVPQDGGGAIWQKGGSHVEHVELARPTPTGYREYMVSAGIALDKARLELGESTDRKDLVHSGSVALQGVPDEELKTALLKVMGKLGDLGGES
jgi:hypothetical protein